MQQIKLIRIVSTTTLTLALLASGCGAGSSLTQQRTGAEQPARTHSKPTAASTQQTVPLPHFDVSAEQTRPSLATPRSVGRSDQAGWAGSTGRDVSSAGLDLSALPPLPRDSATDRQASAVPYTDQADPGSPVAKSANTAVATGLATLSSSTKTVAWAYYSIPITGTKTPSTLQISGTMLTKANGFKSGIFVGLADYTLGRWVIQPNIYNLSASATVNFGATDSYKSPGRKLYVLLATFNGDVAQISGIQTSGSDSNVAPTAQLVITPRVAYTPANLTLDATTSTDGDGFIVKYEFNFGDGAGFVDNGATPTKAHNFATPGTYDCQVRVTDDGGLNNTITVPIIAVDPASFLPLSWYQARINAGLADATMGNADVLGPGKTYQTFSFAGYKDLETLLPPYFFGAYDSPEDLPAYANAQGDNIQNAAGLQDLLLEADGQFMSNYQIQPQTFTPTLDPAQPLAKAIADFVTAAGGTAQQSTYQAAIGAMPADQQKALAPLFYACSDALTRRAAAFATLGLTNPTDIQNLFTSAQGDPLGGVLCVNTGQYVPIVYDVTGGNYLLAGFPYSDAFFTGAAEMTDALDQLNTFRLTNPVWANVNLTVDTPVGRIEISGTGDDTHTAPLDGNGHALLIDLGGNDTYNCQAGGTASGANGVSLCVDMSGNDTYNRMDDPNDVDRTMNPSNDNTSQQGAGRLGIGMLVDYGGDDHYHSVRMSQGSCVFGVGLLADYSGDDSYDMEVLGQGGAFAGIGILYDKSGKDSYTGYSKVQGFGGLMGVGMLVDDGSGNDTYLAIPAVDPTKPEYNFADGTSNINASLAQGAAFGSRQGFLGTPQFSAPEIGGGGFGLLYDGGGSDTYTCGWFGQGFGYFESTGILLDRGGDDTYTGYAATQGAAQSMGLGCLIDTIGTDHYSTTSGVGLGGATQLSVAWLLDLAGTDTYDTSVSGLGASTANAFGYFLDYAGADSYGGHTSGYQDTSLGRGGAGTGGDVTKPGYGIFVDNGGADTYAPAFANMASAAPNLPGDNKYWVRTVDGTYTNGRGSGIDVGP